MCEETLLVRKYGFIFVGITIFLITFVPITAHLYIFKDWLSYHERSSLLWLGPFDLAVLSIWVNYYKACTTSPGYVPKSYDPTLVEGSSKSRKKGTAPVRSRKARWCADCLAFKAPRSHHCSYCRRCILRMDHHCPWLNTCVGHFNLPYFVRFVSSVGLASFLGISLIGFRIYEIVRYQHSLTAYYDTDSGFFRDIGALRYTPPPESKEIIFMIVDLGLLFVLLFSVGILSIWQLWYVARNVTTIESFENSSIEDLIAKKRIDSDIAYPYDLGIFKNLQFVFGPNVYLWAFPHDAFGDGINFETNDQSITWPPKEYYLYKKYPYGKPKKHSSGRNHVRKDSEGFVVKMMTAEEREALLDMKKGAEQHASQDSSTDYDSMDDFIEDHTKEVIQNQSEDESESETLAQRRTVLKSQLPKSKK